MEKMNTYKLWKQDPSKGEVFTSVIIVNEMLDEIPLCVWKNPTSTFCDLSMGKGTYLIEIVNRLVNIYGYSEEDAKSRVFGYDIRVKYVNYLKRRGYKNVFNRDSLIENFNMKFDVSLGNPPYQELDDNGKSKGGGKGGDNNLWSKFVLKSMEIADHVLYIHPPSFLSPNHNVLKKMTELGGIKKIKIYDKSPFEGVNTLACYYHWEKNFDGDCKMNGVAINLDNKILPNSSNELDFTIFEKFFGHHNKFTFQTNSKLHKTNKKHFLNNEQTEVFCYKTYHGSKIIFSSIKTEEYSKLKVIISDSGYLNPKFDTNCNTTQHSFYEFVSSKQEGENLVRLLDCKLYKNCLQKSKFSGFFHGDILKNIPKVDLQKVWTNEELYEYFRLTEQEIQHIENNVIK